MSYLKETCRTDACRIEQRCLILLSPTTQDFLKKSDVNKTGYLDLYEFTDYLIEHERHLHFHFKELDQNQDGKLCLDEIQGAFKRIGVVITTEEAEKLSKR